ncbi:hypothetical protein AJ80_08508 [Polytolypa hystricis UAMH7299]|uniref:MIF4G domain-containing protein n=1 Tax=Polytolypa hystricis (strain UAMH7299) TaxID=1447883 RepID=A0A2B7X680_POLH7|nr:hypothetical protein AJ80_08508 [Polytolypa hystricis UAMH7299]
MTSISQTPGLPKQGQSTTSQAPLQGQSPAASTSGKTPSPGPARSYANATKKSFSQTVTGETANSLVAASGPAQQHGKSPSTIIVNGKTPMPQPSVPAAGGLTIVNGNTAPNSSIQGDHSRKPSVTISAAGASGFIPNGGPVSAAQGRPNNLRFGSIDTQGSSPIPSHAVLQNQSQQGLGVAATGNPRITSPQSSPSPIPQPLASGGRPPSSLQGQGNNLSFGSFPGDQGDANRPMRPGPQGPLGPNNPSSHLRRESSQSAHGDMGNHALPAGPGRGAYPPQGGRGRNFNHQHQAPMPYNSPGASYRTPSSGRGGPNMGHQFHNHNQGRPLGPSFGSPHQASRSPALAHANPATPTMGQISMANPPMQAQHYGGYQHVGPQQVKQHSSYSKPYNRSIKKPNGPRSNSSIPRFTPSLQFTLPPTLSPESGHFEQCLTMLKSQTFGPPGYDVNPYYYQGQPYPMHQMTYMPPSPRPHYAQMPHGTQPPYMPAQYANQGQPPASATPMSKSPSQVSAPDRPGSSVGQAPPPSVPITQGPSHSASRSTSSPVGKSQFIVPPKRHSALVVIRNPDDHSVITFDKPSSSPARATPSPSKMSTTPVSTPPPRSVSRTEDQPVVARDQTEEDKKQSFQDAVAQKIRMDNEAAEARKKAIEDQKLLEAQKQKEKEAAEAKARQEEEEKAKKAVEEAEKAEKAAAEQEAAKKEAEKIEAEKKKEEESKPAAPVDDEVDFDAIERELAAIEAQEAAAEAAYQEKRRREKEEKELKEKEEIAAYERDMKKAEAEAEALEAERARKREQEDDDSSKKEKADLFASLKHKGAQTPASTESPAIRTPAESGAATPVSDISMGPPAKPTSGTKREKPAALKLETTKTVEPPQPSAAMKSLQTARFLDDPSKVLYPQSIVSPNPALNVNAPTDRKFKYNKEFLLQFQAVFKEKPSIDWDARVRETVGDSGTESARGGSARTPQMGPRGGSRPGVPNAFTAMGRFAQAPGGRTPSGPGGQDFPMAGSGRAASMGANPFAFPRGPGGLPMGTPMSRTGSSSALHQMPSSPRVGGSHRGSTRSGSKRDKSHRKDDEQHNKSMPLTAGLDIKPLAPSQSGWKPRSIGAPSMSGPAPGAEGYMPPDVVQRKVKSNLNKMTPEKFDRIADQILEIVQQSKDESDGRTLRQVIQLTFVKATDEAHWAPMYAKFCKRMLDSMSPEIKDENIRDKGGNIVTGGSLFRKYLLNRCQEEFERGWKLNLPEKPEGVTEEIAMMSDEYYAAAAAKRRGLGLVKFIGELYKLGMLTERIMHECVKKLVDYEGIPEEAEVESLTSLLKTIGYSLDNSEKGHSMMDAYFDRIIKMMRTPNLASRLRFMLMDIVDLRKANWASKDADKGPKTIVEIREEAARAQQEADAERARQAANRSGGGGRMALGRGDARNFSGGYGHQAPPPDFAGSKVGTDDLRRLKASRSTNQPMSFGPSSMFGSRSNSGRRNLGPGGSLVRGGDDSGASSRTGTPPGGKDKKDDKEAASSINAFSALASLDAGDSLATSPPSNPSSPQMMKSRPAAEKSLAKDE